MRDHDQKYYLIKSGEVKKRAEEHRKTYIRLMDELWKVVESFGCTEARIDRRMMLIEGLRFKGDVPLGWTKPKRRGVSYPKRGTLGASTKKFFTPSGSYCVETHPELQSFEKWLGCPFHCAWKSKDGKSSGSYHLGRLFSDGVVFWYDPQGPMMLELPDVARAKKDAEEQGRIVENKVLDWVPPKGLKEILKEEWDLMAAKHKHREKERLSGCALIENTLGSGRE